MAAYLLAFIDVHDETTYALYRPKAAETVAAHGGRFIVRGGSVIPLEGEAPPRVVVIEFPDLEAAHAWYHSPEYQEAAVIRKQASSGHLFFVEGVAPPV